VILLYLWIVSLCVRLKLRDLFRVRKRLGVFFFFHVVWNFSVHLGWRFLHDMIFCVSFPCFYVDWKSQVTLDAESTLFWATHDKIFSGCEWGSFSCFYLNPLLEHCELPMMLYDLLRASIIFVLLLAPWARVGLKFFFRCDLIRLWAAGAGLLVQSCNCCVWVSFSLQVGP